MAIELPSTIARESALWNDMVIVMWCVSFDINPENCGMHGRIARLQAKSVCHF